MYRHILASALSLLLTVMAPAALAAAHPAYDHAWDPQRSEPHHHHHPTIDWSAAPADIQALKGKLDRLVSEQKQLFTQMKQQRQAIHKAHEDLTNQERHALKGELMDQMKKLHATRDAMRSLKDRSHAAWDRLYEHHQAKQWDAVKRDLTSIISLKQEMMVNQKIIVRSQQRIMELMKK